MRNYEIVARFLMRFAVQGFPPMHGHDSARSPLAVRSQPAMALYLDADHDMETTEAVLMFCIKEGWIVEPFGLTLGLGLNQETFECTQAGLDKGRELVEAVKKDQ